MKIVYLAGAMEKAGEYGKKWREDITPHLQSIGYKIWNPYNEEQKVGANVESLKKLKSTDFVKYQQLCHKIVDHDLESLKECSLVVCILDQACQEGAGTYGELTVCRLLGIPVYALINRDRGIYDIPSWIVGCLTRHTNDKAEFYRFIPRSDEL